MKKALFLMMFFPSLLFAQVDSLKSKVKKNEIIVNAFELIVGGIVPISYERFIDKNQSITVKTFFLDKSSGDFNSEKYDQTKVISFQTQYNFYFSEKKQNAGFFFAPFLKFTGGKYTPTYESYYDYNGNRFLNTPGKALRVNALISGFGIGYKFLSRNKVSFGFSIDIGRVLNKAGYYQLSGSTEARLGANLGIRF